jgi:hypothetical protein
MNISDLQKRVLGSNPPVQLLLDQFPNAAAAYSLRKLRSNYTGDCIQVRRSSDNTLQDIGFVNRELDTSSLLSFVGEGNGFVETWYDQSLNNNNAVQSDITRQPQIVLNGNLLLTGTKPSLNFDGSNDFLATNNQIFNTGLHSFFTVLQNFQQRAESFFGNRSIAGSSGFINGYRISPSRFFAANPGYYKDGTITTRPVIPNVVNPSHETILADGWFEYIDNPPSYDSNTQRLQKTEVIEGVVQYEVIDLTPEEIEQNTQNQIDAENQAKRPDALKEIAELYLRENMSRMPQPQLERLSVILDRFDESQSYSEERLVLKDNKPHIIKGGNPIPVINNPKVTRITRLQGMLMLQQIGKYDEVDAIMQQAPRPTQIAFYNANYWERDSQMINEAGQIIGMSETELDQFFVAASQIVLP